MTRSTPPLGAHLWLPGLALLLATSASAASLTSAERRAIETTYRQERAACMRGETLQETQSCIKEAGGVRLDALRQTMPPKLSAAELERNALARCETRPSQDRPTCQRMARGEGEAQGSVTSGAIIKQLVTRTVEATPPAPAPVPVPSSPQ